MSRSKSGWRIAVQGGEDPSQSPTPTFIDGLKATLTSSKRYRLGILVFLFVLLILGIATFQTSGGSESYVDVDALLKAPVQLQEDLDYLNKILKEHFISNKQSYPQPVFSTPLLTPSQKLRYQHLIPATKTGKYMLTTIIRQIQDQLPDLLTTLVVLIDFLGPTHLSFSFLEGPSTDLTTSTFESVLHPLLITLGVPPSHIQITTDSPAIDFEQGNRIALLAELRNKALEPLWMKGEQEDIGTVGEGVKQVVFFNDVYLKAELVLEVLHQHVINHASISTGWDWYKRDAGYYYDVWVGKTVDTGDIFYPIPHGWWAPSSDLFPNSPSTRTSFQTLQPFQVFSSWNGLAVFDPTPFLPPHNVRFRRGSISKGECAASECQLVCSDFWREGFGKVQVVPAVQLAYERDEAVFTEKKMQQQRTELGWRDGVPARGRGHLGDIMVSWTSHPPKKIRCNAWPERNGLSANVWETTKWVEPWIEVEVA